jgi:putative redox protein
MEQTVSVTWEKNMKFVSNINGHVITVDAGTDNGGDNEGTRPKPLIMVALGGCTGMDVISILKKMQVDITYFNVRIVGDSLEEHPKKYKSLKVIYEFKGNNLVFDKLEKAVNLSVEKYCGVIATLKESVKIEYEIVVL